MGFKLCFKRFDGLSRSDGEGQVVPEHRGDGGKGTVAPSPFLGSEGS